MTKVSDLADQAPKILLYGPLGTGKSALALTLGERAQVIDTDDGLKTGITLKDAFTQDRMKVDVCRYIEPSPHKNATVFRKVKERIFSISDEINSKKYPFDALIIDSLSSLAEHGVRQIMTNSGGVQNPPQLQHWGLAFIELKNVIAVLRSLPIPVILIAHDQQKGEGSDEKTIIGTPGKNMPSEIARYFDEVWYARVKEEGGGKTKYVIQTKSTSKVVCRTRSGIPDMTDTALGMWGLIKLCGYVPPPRGGSDVVATVSGSTVAASVR